MALSDDFTVQYTSPKGASYVISFSIFSTKDFKSDIEIYDLVLKKIGALEDDGASVLSFIVNETIKFIDSVH